MQASQQKDEQKLPPGWTKVQSKKNPTYYIGPAGPQWDAPDEAHQPADFVSPAPPPSAPRSARRRTSKNDSKKADDGGRAAEEGDAPSARVAVDAPPDLPEPSSYMAAFRPWDAASIARAGRLQSRNGYDYSPSQRPHPKAKNFFMQSTSRADFVDHKQPKPESVHQWPIVGKPEPFGNNSSYRSEFAKLPRQKPPPKLDTTETIPKKPFVANSSYRDDFEATHPSLAHLSQARGADMKHETLTPTALAHQAREAAKQQAAAAGSNQPPEPKSTRGDSEVGHLVLQYHRFEDEASRKQLLQRVGKKSSKNHQGAAGELSGALLSSGVSTVTSSYREAYVPQPRPTDDDLNAAKTYVSRSWLRFEKPEPGHFKSLYQANYEADAKVPNSARDKSREIDASVKRRNREGRNGGF